MADATSDSGNIIDSIRTQLEGLKRTEDGMLLYRLIERGLGKRPDDTGGTDEAFLTFLYTLLERYAKNRDGDPITRIKVRVIQQRITPHLLHEQAEETPPDPSAVESEPEAVVGQVSEPETEAEVATEAQAPVEEPEEVAQTPEVDTEVGASELDSLELMPDLAAELERGGDESDPPEEPVEIENVAPEPEPEPEPVKPVETTPEPIKPVRPEDLVNTAASQVEENQKAEPSKPTPKKKTPAKKIVSKSKTGQSKPKAKKKPEPPKKPVKLELVDPSDLTQPYKVKEQPPKKEEAYIDLGGEEASPVPKQVKKQAAKKAPAKAVKKQELMPKTPTKTSAPAAKSDTGEPSQERVEKLHEAFVHKMAESITRSQDYHRLLRSHMKAIELAENENDFKDLQSLLLRGMEDLLKGNEALGRDLDSTSHYLKIARLDRALLKDELGRIKDNTTVDELTALQNKDAFIKQLESEISRVNRYGFSFAIAVLDIDDLKNINNKYGRDAGDEVLRCYARQILSQFRSYDLVARHREDEFLLLFPNTQKEGAMRAVEKAQKKAANLYINHKDKNIKVPTFTSVLTTYTPGDKPETLLKRTTEAMAQAQKQGRNQVILALPTA